MIAPPSNLGVDEAAAWLTANDPRFAIEAAVIRGRSQRVFANAPRHVGALLDAARTVRPDGAALVYENERWSHEAMRGDVARLANALIGPLGVRPGDHVAIASRNFPELALLILAVAAAGATAAPLNAWWTGEELAFALRDCGARLCFADGPRLARLAPHADALGLDLIGFRDAPDPARFAALMAGAAADMPDVEIDRDADFAVMYSSGSTGRPKGVVQTHRGAVTAAWSFHMSRVMAPLLRGYAAPAAPVPQSWLIITPLFHVTALQANLLPGLLAGARVTLMRKWDADDAIRLIDAEGVTRISGVPTQTADLAERVAALGVSLPTLDIISGGGAKRPGAQVAQIEAAFPGRSPATGWGMTETNALGITLVGADYLAHPDAAGRLMPPLQEMRIIAEDGADVAHGAVGELLLRGPNVMRCYLNRPEETAEALRGGWMHTGDLARIGPGGFVYFVDRKKALIIRGGENISCAEVEEALHHHPAVAEAAAFSIPHARLGEVVAAAIRLKDGAHASDGDILAHLGARLAAFKLPERLWRMTGALPRGATDKIDRKSIRAACLADDADAGADAACLAPPSPPRGASPAHRDETPA